MKRYFLLLVVLTVIHSSAVVFAAETPPSSDNKESTSNTKPEPTSEKEATALENKEVKPTNKPKAIDEQTGPAKVLLLDPKILNLDEKTAKLITSFITAELSQYSTLDIISGEDMRRMMELEAEKQSIGCTDDSNCLAELAGALGADLVIYGELGKLGNQYMLQQSLFDTKAGKAIARISLQSESVDVIPSQLRPKLRYLVKDFLPKDALEGVASTGVQPTAPAPPQVKTKPIPLTSWILYGSGGLAMVAGSALTYLGSTSYQNFETSKNELNSAQTDTEATVAQKALALKNKNEKEAEWAATGQAFLWSGVTSLTLGIASVAAGFYFYQEADSE